MLPLQTEAVVLRTVNFGEADRIVTLLGRQTGKVSALARGARKSVRRFTGMGSAAFGMASLRERGGDLWSLEGFEVHKPRTELATDLVKAAHAAYACELTERLCGGQQADPDTFVWLDLMLDRLTIAAPSSERLRAFELGLLHRLGLAPGLSHCAGCGRDDLGRVGARWVEETMTVLCPACGTRGTALSAEVVMSLQQLAVLPLTQVDGLCLSPVVNRSCRNLLTPFIEHHVGGPLKSLLFLAKLAKSARSEKSAKSAKSTTLPHLPEAGTRGTSTVKPDPTFPASPDIATQDVHKGPFSQ